MKLHIYAFVLLLSKPYPLCPEKLRGKKKKNKQFLTYKSIGHFELSETIYDQQSLKVKLIPLLVVGSLKLLIVSMSAFRVAFLS